MEFVDFLNVDSEKADVRRFSLLQTIVTLLVLSLSVLHNDNASTQKCILLILIVVKK